MPLAMHMPNELLSPGVAVGFLVLAAALLAYASYRSRRQFDADRLPLMGVMGAFVFAAQMINFPIWVVPVSGHLGGGVLLAILLGPHAATLVMASILIVQCLIFQDGGLLALGTNIINMGVIPCYLGHWLFSVLAGRAPGAGRLYLAVVIAAVVGMLAGAAMVPFEVTLSGVAAVPLGTFLLIMVGFHLLIAVGEGLITFLVIGFLANARPASLGEVTRRLAPAAAGLSRRTVLSSLFVAALLIAGVASLYASGLPDALEFLTGAGDEKPLVKENPNPLIAHASEWQAHVAPLPDYSVRHATEAPGTSLSGLIGTLVTLLVIWLVGRALRRNGSTRDGVHAASHRAGNAPVDPRA
jgi:cobalt/nickel transport system permease protein